MSEFKVHHLVVELLDALETEHTPEELVEYLQRKTHTSIEQSQYDVYDAVQYIARKLTNPQAFLSKYEELKQKDVDFLDAFVQVLKEVSGNDGLKSFLRHTVKTKLTPNSSHISSADLAQVRHNLKEAATTHRSLASRSSVDNLISSTVDMLIEKPSLENMLSTRQISATSTNITGNKETSYAEPVINPWVHRYPNMSSDYGSMLKLQLNSGGDQFLPAPNPGMMTGINRESQEHMLIDDLLNILMGIPGQYIQPKSLSHRHDIREFTIHEAMDESLRMLVKQILPLASHFSAVQRFNEDKMAFECGQVNNALADCMSKLAIEYMTFVTQMETEFRSDNLNLHNMRFYIQQNLHTLNILDKIVTTINKSEARGGKVLSLLQELIDSYIGDQHAHGMCLHLMEHASVPYMKMLGMWISSGIISDPEKEFLIIDNEVVTMEDNPVDYCADYWDKKYTLARNRIPKFLEAHTDMILRAGKYLNVILQCGKLLDNPLPTIQYHKDERKYIDVIEQSYTFASRKLLELIMDEQDLLGHLRSVKHYFLLDQGDFIVTFLDLSDKELERDIKDVLRPRLNSLMDYALRTTSASNDPHKENLRTTLLPHDLQTQMFKILMIQTSDELKYKSQKTGNLSVIESFAFNYEVSWPLNLVLNRKSITRYQMIFRHLFYCKYVERLLCQVWRANMVGKKFTVAVARQYRAVFGLRERMLHYVQNLESHMMVEVIEPHWCIFLSKISKVANVDEVLCCHNDFLDNCLKDCMLTNPSILAVIVKLLHICVRFSKFMQLDNSNLETITDCQKRVTSFKESISTFDFEFTGAIVHLLDQIRNQNKHISDNDRLFNLLYRLDSNSYYSGEVYKLHLKKYLPTNLSVQT